MPQVKGKVEIRKGVSPSDQKGMMDIIGPSVPTDAQLEKMYEEYYAKYPTVPRPNDPNYNPYPNQNALYGAYTERLPSENLLSELVPANVRAGYSYERGPITQRFFPERDLGYLRDVYEQGRNAYYAGTIPQDQGFVHGAPQLPSEHFMPYEEYTRQRAVPSMQSVPGAMNSLYSYFDPAYRLAPFTEGAYYEEGPGGMYMHNTYNAGGVPREVNVLLPKRSQR